MVADPAGWQIKPQDVVVPRLGTYKVLQTTLHQKFNLDRLTAASREPLEIQFINGHDKVVSPLQFKLPIATSDRREGPLVIDGKLDDWTAADAIQEGPLVQMLNRPAVQKQELQPASTNSTVFTSWGRENFYLAFAVDGIATETHRSQNFVDYQERRAWGEDLCEILIQPIGPRNSARFCMLWPSPAESGLNARPLAATQAAPGSRWRRTLFVTPR